MKIFDGRVQYFILVKDWCQDTMVTYSLSLIYHYFKN